MTDDAKITDLGALLAPYADKCNQYLDRWLIEPGVPDDLARAMRYCVMNGGKRLRPAMVQLAAEAGGCDEVEIVGRASVAIELVHSYSLVHDDLPAMDDDVLRRGRPTAHVQFGEAMAILAGDALLTRAVSVLAESNSARANDLVLELTLRAGPAGMIAGQVADMKLCDVPGGIEGVTYIHMRKTAALLRAAAAMGGIAGGLDDSKIEALGQYGQSLGLAFQVFDDILDVTADAAALGKTPGKDADSDKLTVVAQIGLDAARKLGAELSEQSIAALDSFGPRGDKLIKLADLLIKRTH
ncbi:MAG: polyprenyl synthetase family protein [Phycisphaerales bacterium]|jgi:geranylgeranyl pyrophosphate synthase|nr:polyprenyl synthetase family protein [Phycisphaerales bacterium]